MACNECKDHYSPCTSCNDTCPDGDNSCNCVQKDMSTDCIVYTGDDLACSGISQDTILTVVIQDLDAFICNKFEEAIQYLTLINIGTGAEIFAGINGIGNKELRTILSGDLSLIDVVENTETIDIIPGTPSLTKVGDIVSFIVTTLAGATTFSTIDLSEYNYDTFVQSASFDSGTSDLTIVRNNSEPDIVIPLDFLNNHVESGVYNSNTITLTLTDGNEVDIDLTALVNEILTTAADNQVNSDYLEDNPASKAHILNRNPSRSVTGNYTVLNTDNNYIIEIDNGTTDVTINLGSITANSEFFVGFVQKGTGIVTFTGYDIKPLSLSDILFGQGHVAAVEAINSTLYLHGNLLAE